MEHFCSIYKLAKPKAKTEVEIEVESWNRRWKLTAEIWSWKLKLWSILEAYLKHTLSIPIFSLPTNLRSKNPYSFAQIAIARALVKTDLTFPEIPQPHYRHLYHLHQLPLSFKFFISITALTTSWEFDMEENLLIFVDVQWGAKQRFKIVQTQEQGLTTWVQMELCWGCGCWSLFGPIWGRF